MNYNRKEYIKEKVNLLRNFIAGGQYKEIDNFFLMQKKSDLKDLEATITKVTEGKVVFSETVKKSIEMLSKGKKSERLFKKLSTREIEVLRYLNDGKKNKEVAQILGLDEKTISTYKLRLLAKLNVTNLVDLLKKAKDLDVI